MDSSLNFEAYFCDGQPAGRGEILACISGRLKGILLAERVALNCSEDVRDCHDDAQIC